MRKNLRDRGFTKFKIVEHPRTQRSAEIRVNKSSGEFACAIGDMEKKDKDLHAVEQWAIGMLKKKETTVLDWVPVIYAHVEGDRYGRYNRARDEDDERSVEVKVKAERFWIAKASRDPNGNEVWRKIHWIQGDPEDSGCLPEDQKFEVSVIYREPKERTYYGDGDTPAMKKGWVRLPEVQRGFYTLAYTPELWAGIQHVIDTIENEEKILNKLFQTKEGQETLAKLGSQPELLRLSAKTP